MQHKKWKHVPICNYIIIYLYQKCTNINANTLISDQIPETKIKKYIYTHGNFEPQNFLWWFQLSWVYFKNNWTQPDGNFEPQKFLWWFQLSWVYFKNTWTQPDGNFEPQKFLWLWGQHRVPMTKCTLCTYAWSPQWNSKLLSYNVGIK